MKICGVIQMTIKKFIRILFFLFFMIWVYTIDSIKFSAAEVIEKDIQVHTEVTKETFEMVYFFLTVGIIGGVIGLTLSYVSWKKYKAEKKKQSKKQYID